MAHLLLPNLHYRLPAPKKLFLTFDDGPTDHTINILKVLEKYQAKATFFVLGKRVVGQERTLQDIYKQGHVIGTHSYSHDSRRNLEKLQMAEDETLCIEVIKKILPQWQPEYVRPPYGQLSLSYLWYMRKQQQHVILWSKDAKDYESNDVTKVKRNLGVLMDGDIILMHDEFAVTANLLCDLLPEYKKQGYDFSPIISCG
jgi:peptidoglycan/xylan/chitin deacetylase (PgdA/CDA1 family)